MRKTTLVLGLAAGAVMLSGCSSFGGGKTKRLDEFAVARNAPLVIPPDYTLTPPAPGTASLSASDAQQQAIQALFGGAAPRSASETSLLDKAGGDRVALGIRSNVGDNSTQVVDKGETTRTLLAAQQSDSQVATASVP